MNFVHVAHDVRDVEVKYRVADLNALLAMGFTPTVQIVKTRRVGLWGEVSVSIDEVANLGVFVDLERMVSLAGSDAAVQGRLDADGSLAPRFDEVADPGDERDGEKPPKGDRDPGVIEQEFAERPVPVGQPIADLLQVSDRDEQAV